MGMIVMFNNSIKMGSWDSFDAQVQVEEVYNDFLFPEYVAEGSEDIMDQAVLSLEALKEGARAGSYMMEDILLEAIEMDEFWDESWSMDRAHELVQMRKVGC
jgi:hypothetical protein